MVKIRLSRTGRKNRPAYRIVVAKAESKRDGKFIERIGHYNPVEDPKKVVYKEDRYQYWISVGAQPTDAVKKLVSGKYLFKPYNPNAKAEDTESGIDVVAAESAETPVTEPASE